VGGSTRVWIDADASRAAEQGGATPALPLE